MGTNTKLEIPIIAEERDSKKYTLLKENIRIIKNSSLPICEELRNAFLEYHRRLFMVLNTYPEDLVLSKNIAAYFQEALHPPTLTIQDIVDMQGTNTTTCIERSSHTPHAPYLNVFDDRRLQYNGERLTLEKLLEKLQV